ncbi:hypothetical protein BROUX41_000936 [Berkeleyomyces rouxiae]|uniref:uncharacterized protein n=1 Tax=Berkeleyomyces rouxiae TaxID=2035830 RepID=UPI003B7CA973
MSGSSSAPPSAEGAHNNALVGQVEKGKVKFLIQTGGKKYECVLKDRVAHERRKALSATSSSASVTSGEASN